MNIIHKWYKWYHIHTYTNNIYFNDRLTNFKYDTTVVTYVKLKAIVPFKPLPCSRFIRRLVGQYSVKAAHEMSAHSHRPEGEPAARIMLIILACLVAAAAAAPSVDMRQEGEYNVQAEVQNILVLVALPKKIPYGNLLHLLMKKESDDVIAQDRSDVQPPKSFVKPSTPYKVEIGESERSSGGTVDAEEVVIPGRRRLETESQPQDEMKLIGATEQCGPDRERDPVTLTCRFRVDAIPENAPEVVPS